jgi:hypothetical protein
MVIVKLNTKNGNNTVLLYIWNKVLESVDLEENSVDGTVGWIRKRSGSERLVIWASTSSFFSNFIKPDRSPEVFW